MAKKQERLTVPPNTSANTAVQNPVDYNTAVRLHAEGKLGQAEQILRRILQIQPHHAHAVHLLGIIAHQVGKLEQAIKLIEKAIQINPNVSLFNSNLAEMYRLSGNIDKAISTGLHAVRLDPKSAEAQSNLGIAYFDNKELDLAEKHQLAALEINPSMPQALNNMGSIKRNQKDRDSAIEYYRKVLKLLPNYLESMNNLGAVLTESENAEQSLQYLIRAVQLKPDYAEAHCNLGNAFVMLEDLDKAKIGYQQAIKHKPKYAEAYDGLARIHREKDELDEAEATIKQVLKFEPDRAESHALLGVIYTEQGYPEAAMAAFDQALEINQDLIAAHVGKGHLDMQLGDLKAAEACFHRAHELEPESIGPRLSLTMVRKTEPGDEHMAAMLEEGKDFDNMPELKAMSLHFALGKCHDDIGEYDEAFPHYLAACQLKRKRIDYNPDHNEQIFRRIADFFTPEHIEQLRGPGCPSDLPIVIVGMPRSGTTLTEQILASHPTVHGAGELPDLMKLANVPQGPDAPRGFPGSMEPLSPDDMVKLGDRYAQGLAGRSPQSVHVTDKMPGNFLALGMLHLMLPNAKIIHINRNPLDTCLSNFTRLFNTGQHHTYDLAELGRYYRNYHDLMAHWRSVLPENAFLDLHYEELVKDNDAQTRRLVDFCGLEWDDACLKPHETKRSIRTASVTQVRKPVYTTSVERWRRYEKHLGPLIEALGDLAS